MGQNVEYYDKGKRRMDGRLISAFNVTLDHSPFLFIFNESIQITDGDQTIPVLPLELPVYL